MVLEGTRLKKRQGLRDLARKATGGSPWDAHSDAQSARHPGEVAQPQSGMATVTASQDNPFPLDLFGSVRRRESRIGGTTGGVLRKEPKAPAAQLNPWTSPVQTAAVSSPAVETVTPVSPFTAPAISQEVSQNPWRKEESYGAHVASSSASFAAASSAVSAEAEREEVSENPWRKETSVNPWVSSGTNSEVLQSPEPESATVSFHASAEPREEFREETVEEHGSVEQGAADAGAGKNISKRTGFLQLLEGLMKKKSSLTSAMDKSLASQSKHSDAIEKMVRHTVSTETSGSVPGYQPKPARADRQSAVEKTAVSISSRKSAISVTTKKKVHEEPKSQPAKAPAVAAHHKQQFVKTEAKSKKMTTQTGEKTQVPVQGIGGGLFDGISSLASKVIGTGAAIGVTVVSSVTAVTGSIKKKVEDFSDDEEGDDRGEGGIVQNAARTAAKVTGKVAGGVAVAARGTANVPKYIYIGVTEGAKDIGRVGLDAGTVIADGIKKGIATLTCSKGDEADDEAPRKKGKK